MRSKFKPLYQRNLKMDLQLLQQMIAQDYIKVNKHPNAELYIYNYTQITQFERVWNEATLKCRGLILNNKNEIIARPFPKFFNVGEPEVKELPSTPFQVFDKLDGSLGILYWLNDKPHIASRGSFSSEQSEKANELLNQKYIQAIPNLNPNYTYLFEIIYPKNRIVVNYGDEEKLVLIGVIETKTGIELPLTDIGFPLVKEYNNFSKIEELKQQQWENHEGFVIRFENGHRVKIKFEEYLRLHRILTQFSSVDIWECLSNETSLQDLLENVPDEFFEWVKNVESNLKKQYKAIEEDCKKYFKVLENRKKTAIYFLSHQHSDILFNMLDEKDYSKIIWRKIKPKFEKPFTNNNIEN